jgi:cardiolipin synthase
VKFIGAGARPGQPQIDHDLIFTVPNFLTVLRFMGVPVFVWLVLWQREYGFAVLVLAIMGGTDWVDGYVARRFNQASKLGRILDPLADRLALITVAVTLAIAGVVDWWYLAALVVPDAVLGTPLLVLSKLSIPFPGVYFVIAWVCLGLGLAGHWVAAYNYFWAILRKGKELKANDGGRD